MIWRPSAREEKWTKKKQAMKSRWGPKFSICFPRDPSDTIQNMLQLPEGVVLVHLLIFGLLQLDFTTANEAVKSAAPMPALDSAVRKMRGRAVKAGVCESPGDSLKNRL